MGTERRGGTVTPVPLCTVDAFADAPFAGNPAAVCLLDAPRDAAWMQAVATEMNLAETAFVVPRGEAFGLRWFTPSVEVDLCGHATLAAAHVLWDAGRLDPGRPARFETRSGPLSATRAGEFIELDFPATPPVPAPDAAAALAAALGTAPARCWRSRFDLIAELGEAAAVRAVAPDLRLVARLPVRGVIVTAPGDAAGVDFVSRFFAPQSGVPEDPVTGSAHCALAPLWGERLGRDTLTGVQASRRGGTIRVRRAGDRVLLGGRAITILRGELLA